MDSKQFLWVAFCSLALIIISSVSGFVGACQPSSDAPAPKEFTSIVCYEGGTVIYRDCSTENVQTGSYGTIVYNGVTKILGGACIVQGTDQCPKN
jgi:hypothetical protein